MQDLNQILIGVTCMVFCTGFL